jgi:predicted nucleic acid-binding protein
MILDSSVLLQILLAQKLAKKCEAAIDWKTSAIPTLCLYEIYKKLRSKLTEDECMEAMSPLHVLPKLELTETVALTASDLSLEFKLGMADAIVLAHARIQRKTLITMDNDFVSIAGVLVIR